MTKRIISMKIWGILLFLLLGLLIFLPAFIEYHSTKKDLLHLWRDQSRLVAETIVRGSENMLRYDEEIFAERRNRLKADGLTIRQLDSLDYPDKQRLLQFARMRIGGRVFFFDPYGNLTWPRELKHRHTPIDKFLARFTHLIQAMSPDSTLRLINPAHSSNSVPPGILIRRAENRGFIYVLYRPSISNKMLRFHRLHRWLMQISRSPNILYIQLERGPHILVQTGKLHFPPLSPERQSSIRKFTWQISEIQGKQIFDYIQRAPDGLIIRVGISAAPLEHLQSSLIRRLLINSFLLLIIGFIALRFFISKQNLSFLKEKLHQVETSTGTILRNMGEGIIAVNEQGQLELINQWAQQNFGLSGQASADIHSLPFDASVKKNISDFKEFTDVPFQFNDRFLLLSGRVIEFNTSEKGKQSKRLFLIIVRDFTSQKELEEMRNRRSKLLAMGALASRVAHEIRNPLNGIAMLAQRLQKEFKPQEGEDEYRQMTGAIRKETQRINAIVQSFLLYAKTPEMHFEPVQLKSFLNDLQPVLQAAGPNPLKIELKDNATIRIDRNQMKQVLINLVKNAIEVSSPEEPITIRAESAKGKVLIFVEDRGPGIAPEIQDRIFDLYFTTKNDGAGLGLSIVEKIIQSHGGSIRAESPYAVGGQMTKGTRFIIELPEFEDREQKS